MNEYAIYLRKSRSDMENGEVDVLARHKKILLELARKRKLNITHIYHEVVSGDNIAARPQMQLLLNDVGNRKYSGILVVDVDRLARGDTIDQGIVAQTFKYSDTQIITPMKTYNPNDEFDEEYFEFGLFMSRREYKIINRRLQRGRLVSVKEGKYQGSIPPYGYKRVKLKNEKGFSLAPVKKEAGTVKLIFELYTKGELLPDGNYKRLGVSLIARRLEDLQIPTRTGTSWSVPTIRDILINPVYIGKIRWDFRKNQKKVIDSEIITSRPRSASYILVDGKHPAIIDEKTFSLAKKYMSLNPPKPIPEKNTLKNPLAGIVVCGKCGKSMIRRPYASRKQAPTLMCSSMFCDNISSMLHLVEERILKSLAKWLTEYKLKWKLISEQETNSTIKSKLLLLKKTDKEIATLNKQFEKIHTLLEQGVYTTETFIERSRILSENINKAKEQKTNLEKEIEIEKMREESRVNIIPKIEHLLEVYHQLPDAKSKNDMLREVLEKVTYFKDKKGKNCEDRFEIVLYPCLPSKSE